MTLAEFQRINAARDEAGEERYANPRNLAAGTIKLLDPREVAERKLEIVLYGDRGLRAGQGRPARPSPATTRRSGPGACRRSRNSGRRTGSTRSGPPSASWTGSARRFAYATDGAVVKLDSLALQREAGSTSKAPAVGHGLQVRGRAAETKLLAISVQVGRTGVLTPVAELEPVLLAARPWRGPRSTTGDEIARKDIRVGDFVFVEKAGEVIPAVIGVNLERRTPECVVFKFPTKLPLLRHRGRPDGGRGCPALPELRVPGAGAPPGAAFRLQGLRGHRRPGRGDGRRPRGEGWVREASPTSTG
jgi:DNA ligase (NAD+)